MSGGAPRGAALLLDREGRVAEVLLDTAGWTAGLEPGERWERLLDPQCVEKGRLFWERLTSQGAVPDWEMNGLAEGMPVSVHFAGFALDSGYLLLLSPSLGEMEVACRELLSLNNEQTDSLREAFQELGRRRAVLLSAERESVEEMTRLNNELADAYRELNRQRAELQRLNAEKNRFLGMAAHDLRGPLSSILQYSRFLQEDPQPAEAEKERFLKTIESQSRFMLNLVNALLDVSKIEAGKLDLRLETVDLGSFLKRTTALHAYGAVQRKVALRLEGPEGEIPVRADPDRLSQVLQNLLSNAIKFTPEGGTVTVSWGWEEAGPWLAVRDEGPGLPPELDGKLFGYFAKGKAPAPGGEKGTGLGLAIVKKVVEAHGGTVAAANNAPPPGATFTVRLPRLHS